MLDAQQRRYLLNLILQASAEFRMKRIVCQTNHGDLMVDVRDTDIGHTLLTQGEYGYTEMQNFIAHSGVARGTGDLIDIGANIGTTSIPLALDGVFKKISSFEPDPNNFHMFNYNVHNNKLNTIIQPFNLAMGSTPGTVEFELSTDNFGDHRIKHKDFGTGAYNEGTRAHIDVECTTLDTMIANKSINIDTVVLIKSDTQGNEGHVLKGAKNVLALRRIPWVIEFWPYGLDRSCMPRDEVSAIVMANFSSFIELKEDGITVDSAPIDKFPELFGRYDGVRWCNLILKP